jgi:L-glyceraldehyde 3-phosphate reductase
MASNPNRYDAMPYRRCGSSGLVLPAISLGLWHGFGSYASEATSRELIHTAFDLGITHFDLANNYGGQPGASETPAQKITYLHEMSWSQERLLVGANGIAALTFCDVPIRSK